MKLQTSILLGIILTALFIQCKKESKTNTGGEVNPSSSDVLILNEGNFMWGNADFDVYNFAQDKLSQGCFKQTNSAPLGDVLQSALQIGNYIYLVVNNSGKIVVIDAQTYKYKNVINGFTSPRYMSLVNDSIAAVTDLYAAKIYLVNLRLEKIVKQLPVSGACEELLAVSGNTYICNTKGQLYILNHSTLAITDSIKLNAGAQWIRKDAADNLWVLCSKSGNSSLVKINTVSAQITRTVAITGNALKLCSNSSMDTLFFINADIKFLDLKNPGSLPQTYFEETGANFYGLNYDNRYKMLYASDAKDYVSKSAVYLIPSIKTPHKALQTGIITSDFLFVKR